MTLYTHNYSALKIYLYLLIQYRFHRIERRAILIIMILTAVNPKYLKILFRNIIRIPIGKY